MKKKKIFIDKLKKVMAEVDKEKRLLSAGESLWTSVQIYDVVLPEITNLLNHAEKNEIYFEFGRKQRMLESTYCITDSLTNLGNTDLGRSILDLQELYYKISK